MKPIQSKILLSLLLFATHKTNAMLFPSQADMDAAAKDDDIKSATNSTASLKSAPSTDQLAQIDSPSAPTSNLRPVSPVDGVAGGSSYVPPRSITPNQAITPTDDGIKSATNSTTSLTSAPSGDRLAESDGTSAPASHLRSVSPVDGVADESSYAPPRSVTPNPAIAPTDAPTAPAASASAGTSNSPAHQTIPADDTVTAATPTGDAAAPTSISTPASSTSAASATSAAPTTISNLRAATADLPEMKDSTGVADDAPYEHTPAPTGAAASTAPTTADTPPALPATPARSDTPALPTVNVKYSDFFNLMDQPEFVVVQDPLALITYVDKLKSIVVQTTHDTWGTGKASEVTDIADVKTVYAWANKLYSTAASASPSGRCTLVPKALFEQIMGKLKNLVERYAQDGISLQVGIELNDPILNNVIFDDGLAFFDSGTDALPAQPVSAGDAAPALPATPSPTEKEDDDGDAAALPTSPSPAHMEMPERQPCEYLPAAFVKELARCALEVRDAIDRKISTPLLAPGIEAATDFDDSKKIHTWAEELNTSVERNTGTKIVIPANTLQQILKRLKTLAQHYSKASFSDDSFATEFVLYDPTKSTEMCVFNTHINFGSKESDNDSSTGSYSNSDDEGTGVTADTGATSAAAISSDAAAAAASTDEVLEYAFVIADGNSAHCAEAQLVAYAQNVLDGIEHYIREGNMLGEKESASDTRNKLDAQAILTWAKDYEELQKKSRSFMLVSKETLDKALARLHVLAKLYGRKVVLLESATNYTNPKGMGQIGSFVSEINFAPEVVPQSAVSAHDDDGIPSLGDTVWDDPLDAAAHHKSNDGELPAAADTRNTDSQSNEHDFDKTEYRAIENKDALAQYAQEIKDGINARIAKMSDAEVELTKETLERDYQDTTEIINWSEALQKSTATVIAGATISAIMKRLHDLARIYTKKNRAIRSVTAPSLGEIFERDIMLSAPEQEAGSESEDTTSSNNDDGSTSGSSNSASSDDAGSASSDDDGDLDAFDGWYGKAKKASDATNNDGSKSDDGSCDEDESENNDDEDDKKSTPDDGSGSRSKSTDFVDRTNWPTQKTKCVLVESDNTTELYTYVRTIREAIGNKLEETNYPTSSPELDRDQSAWNDICEIETWAVSLVERTNGCRTVVPDALMKKVLKKLETLAPQYRIAHLVDDFFISRTGDYEILQADEGDGHPTVIFCREVTLPSEKTTNPSTHGSMGDGSTCDDDDDDENLSVHSDEDTGNKPKAPRDPITPKKPVVTQSSLTGKMLKIVTNKFVITGGVVAAVAWYYYYYMADTRAERDTDQPETTAKTTLKQTNLKPIEA